MRRWVILCLLVACERAGESQNPIDRGSDTAMGPTGPRAIVDASIATTPSDAGPAPVIADAAPIARPTPNAQPRARALQDEAAAYAKALAIVGSSKDSDGDMSRRRMSGSDLAGQIDAVKHGGRTVSISGGGGRGHVGGTVHVGAGGGIGTGGGAKIDSTSGPNGRVSVSSKRAVDDTSLTIDMVLAKVQAAYVVGIKRCYKTSLRKDASARGRLTLSFRVDETGRTTAPRATGFVKELDECVVGIMSSWRFPIPKDTDGEAASAGFEISLQLVPD